MHTTALKYLYDIRRAADRISKFCNDKNFDDYEANDQLRAAVERQFEISGEALNQLTKKDQAIAAKITAYRHIIAFRNLLIHGYADVDDRLVWDMVQFRLPTLQAEILALSNPDQL